MNDRKKFNKHYSNNRELLHGINLTKDDLRRVIKECIFIEPFAGECDLIEHFRDIMNVLTNRIVLMDITKINPIEPIPGVRIEYKQMDTLLNDPFKQHRCKQFVITNPPYTAKNKLTPKQKRKYDSILDSNTNDLYQIFIKQLLMNADKINGGVIIVPVNFMLGKQTHALRDAFLNAFDIYHLNIFEKQMFEHTTQSTITLVFTHKRFNIKRYKVYLHTERSVEIINMREFERILSFSFDSYFHLRTINSNTIRACRNFNIATPFIVSNIKVSLIDPKMFAFIDKTNKDTQDKVSDRSIMRVCFTRRFTTTEEERICELFNKHLQNIRTRTHSLVLTSYREKSRKRLTFEEAYKMLEYIVNEELV